MSELMWWCPTCQRRVPQPRWMNPGQPDARSYHIDRATNRDHTITRVSVLDGELIERRAIEP